MLRPAQRVAVALSFALAALSLRYKLGWTSPKDEGLPEGATKQEEEGSWAKQEEKWAYRIPFVRMPHTPVLTCEPGYSVLMSHFDWQVVPESAFQPAGKGSEDQPLRVTCNGIEGRPWRNDTVTAADPRTVWAAADGLERLFQLAEERLDDRRSDRVVVFSGTELPLSRAFGSSPAERATTVARLRRYFGKILYQVKDMELEHVSVAPMGFCWGYHLMALAKWFWIGMDTGKRMARTFLELDELFTAANLSGKTRGILATGALVATWLEHDEIQRHVGWFKNKKGLPGYPPSNSSFRAVATAALSRHQMRVWADSAEGRAAGAELRRVPVEDWWHELYTYRFLCSPMGSAIQTSKTVEALMVLTVPIIQRMGYALHDELIDMGFPIVLVEEWPEVTSAAVEGWWRATSPRLESFRRNCLTVDSYWRMFVGELRRCT
mmetsp:Transcript_23078/g.73071  ORF Transcript_23078/g.73071 Transcript_23078/m.73071 type:complete len:436 (+) Transcript_23078:211-1518(+)